MVALSILPKRILHSSVHSYIELTCIYVGGDILLRIDDTPITRIEQMETLLEDNYRVGDVVTLTLMRDGVEYRVDVALEEEPN